jgi:bifunctional non-homologous end joining protein LigD
VIPSALPAAVYHRVVSRARARPSFVEPTAAQLAADIPEGREWLYELQFDGYRALVLKDGENVSINSRNREDLTHSYPSVVNQGGKLKA